jgi:murein DD-endopeptidase MepM/ murein hydrolase activator NlpD
MIGIHFQADTGRSEDEMYAIGMASGGRTHVVINGEGLAARLLQAGKRVIYRRWRAEIRLPDGKMNEGDNQANDVYDAVDFVNRIDREAPRGAILALGNEPWVNTPDAVRRLNDWTVQALRRCNELGRKAGIFSLPTGNPPDPALWQHARGALQLAKDGGHLLLLHEYFGVDGDTDALSGKNAPWHVNRHTLIPADLPLPEIAITELGLAYRMDAEQGYVGKLSDDAYADQLVRIQRGYAQHGIDSCVFVVTNKGNKRWGTFNLSERVIQRVAAYNATEKETPVTPPVQPPAPVKPAAMQNPIAENDPRWKHGLLRPAGDPARLRFVPSTENNEHIRLLDREHRVVYARDAAWGDWAQVRFTDGFHAWVHSGYVVFTEDGAQSNTPDGFWLLYPIEGDAWRNQGLGAARAYGPHEGVDYVASDQNATLYILTAHDGAVEEVGWDADGLGYYVRLVHEWKGQTYKTWYGHLAQRPALAFGQEVKAGQRIGIMGSTGNSSAKHLHLILQGTGGVDDVYWLDDVLDPTPYIVRSIPVTNPTPPPVVLPPTATPISELERQYIALSLRYRDAQAATQEAYRKADEARTREMELEAEWQALGDQLQAVRVESAASLTLVNNTSQEVA